MSNLHPHKFQYVCRNCKLYENQNHEFHILYTRVNDILFVGLTLEVDIASTCNNVHTELWCFQNPVRTQSFSNVILNYQVSLKEYLPPDECSYLTFHFAEQENNRTFGSRDVMGWTCEKVRFEIET